jgi:hypothetical protein
MQRELAEFLLLFSLLAWFMHLRTTASVLGMAAIVLFAADLLTIPARKRLDLYHRAIAVMSLRKRLF